MKLKTFTIAIALMLALFLFAQHRSPAQGKPEFNHLVDLTHTLPAQAVSARVVSASAKAGRADVIDDLGTRIDAPAEFAPGRWTVDQIPADRLLAPLAVIDISAKAIRNPDYHLTPEDIADWEQLNGPVPLDAVVVLRTGWGDKWNSPTQYRNTDARGVMHFPGFSPDAAQFLVESRQAIGLGTDTSSIGGGAAVNPEIARYTGTHSVYELTNIAELWRMPASGALIMVAPAKIAGRTSAPVRLLGFSK